MRSRRTATDGRRGRPGVASPPRRFRAGVAAPGIGSGAPAFTAGMRRSGRPSTPDAVRTGNADERRFTAAPASGPRRKSDSGADRAPCPTAAMPDGGTTVVEASAFTRLSPVQAPWRRRLEVGTERSNLVFPSASLANGADRNTHRRNCQVGVPACTKSFPAVRPLLQTRNAAYRAKSTMADGGSEKTEN